MGLVQQHKGVATHQPCVIWTHAPRDAESTEEQAGADHVHGAHNDRWRRWILQPFAIVDMLAAEGGDWQRAVAESQRAPQLFEFRALQLLAEGFGEICGLIDHRATVNDIDEPTGQRRLGCARQQPDCHNGGFTKTGWNVH